MTNRVSPVSYWLLATGPMLTFLLETFVLGVRNIHLHKLRSFLTTIGIIVGVMAVIVMVAIGQGSKQAALRQLQQLGANNILVRSIKPPESTEATGRMQRVLDYGLKRVDLGRLQALKGSGVARIVPLRDTEQKVTRGDLRAYANAIGTTSEAFRVINLRLSRGDFFTPLDDEQANLVCVIGHTAAKQLFPFQDPLYEKVQIGTSGMNTLVLTIIGVLEPTGLRTGSEGAAMMQRDLDLDIYFPLSLAQRAFGDTIVRRQAGTFERKQIELTEIWMQAERVEDVERLAAVAENIVAGGGMGGGRERPRADVEVKAPIQILRSAEAFNRMFNFVMGGIASLSLLVGGIGIMNIMLATVTERTREIGIRRALGAKRRHITVQFLVETTAICLAGGIVGVGLGASVAAVLPKLIAQYPTSIAPWSIIVSFAVSGFVGIGFGLYPAITAARMDPIEALRHE